MLFIIIIVIQGGVTIFTLPAVPLCPIESNGNKNFKVTQNLGFLPRI